MVKKKEEDKFKIWDLIDRGLNNGEDSIII
jgi:hypothetical protein